MYFWPVGYFVLSVGYFVLSVGYFVLSVGYFVQPRRDLRPREQPGHSSGEILHNRRGRPRLSHLHPTGQRWRGFSTLPDWRALRDLG